MIALWIIDIPFSGSFRIQGTYDEAYSQAVKEARRYRRHVQVSCFDFGSPQHFTISPTATIQH